MPDLGGHPDLGGRPNPGIFYVMIKISFNLSLDYLPLVQCIVGGSHDLKNIDH